MDEPTQNELEDVLENCKWQDVIDCVLAPDTAPRTSHKLVHLVVGDRYHKKVMKPASPYVMEEMERKAGKHHIRQMQNLVQLSMGTPALAATAGIFFERYAHRRLQEGGSFNVRQLSSSKTASISQHVSPTGLQLQCSGVHEFYNLEEVGELANNIYCVPPNHNFPAVDSIMQPDFLFQITIAQKRQIPLDGLLAAAKQLRGMPNLLYFVVPSHIFKKYKFVPGIPEDIEQWVLEVPWM